MTKPLFLLFSLLLTGAVVVLVGWQALFGITVLSFCTLLCSSGPQEEEPQVLRAHDKVAIAEPPLFPTTACLEGDEDIEEAIDEAGWYYPLADHVLALSAA